MQLPADVNCYHVKVACIGLGRIIGLLALMLEKVISNGIFPVLHYDDEHLGTLSDSRGTACLLTEITELAVLRTSSRDIVQDELLNVRHI
jgi:hypothetical protein